MMKIPSMHIMSAGTQVAPYAWIAARCLWLSCPENLRDQLEINIHIFGVRKAERASLVRLFANQPYLTLRHDTILLDDQKGVLGRKRYELLGPTARKYLAKVARRAPIMHPLTKRWLGRSSLVWYHHEWINQLCKDHAHDDAIMIVDSDLFIADSNLFDPVNLRHDPNNYCMGWVWRTNNSASYQNKKLLPMGTELMFINPSLHARLNQQYYNDDFSAFEKLKRAYPSLTVENEAFIDTLFYSSWKAQLEGYRVEARYNDLNVSHPGGVGHLDAQHLTSIPKEIEDSQEWLRLTIGRVRIHYRVLEIIERLGLSSYLSQHLLTRLGNLKAVIEADAQLQAIYEDNSYQIEGEAALEKVEALIFC